jgi:tight adherence protein C
MIPEFVVSNLKSKYQAAIRSGMPDALDLMVISVDSGLALESAIARVAIEMSESYPILSREFMTTGQDLQLNPDVEHALRDFSIRTGIEETNRFSKTLIQSVVYGTPLSQSLHTLSKEMRAQALVNFEETAAKLPTKMTVPMILFILPALMVVIIGPSIGPVVTALSGMSKH